MIMYTPICYHVHAYLLTRVFNDTGDKKNTAVGVVTNLVSYAAHRVYILCTGVIYHALKQTVLERKDTAWAEQ